MVSTGLYRMVHKTRDDEPHIPGEPDALKGARPVREGVVGNVMSRLNLLG